MKHTFKLVRSNAGFTLTEMLIVITLIALVGTFAVQQIMNRYDKARQNATKVQMNNLAVVLDNFKLDCNRYPSTEEGLDALAERPAGLKCDGYDPGGYVKDKKIPKDGFDNSFEYSSSGPSDYTIKSFGRDGKEGGQDADKDVSNKDGQGKEGEAEPQG